MKTLLIPLLTILVLTPQSFADRFYGGTKEIEIYGTRNGLTDYTSGPKAIIEIDRSSNEAKIYKTNPFGFKDILSGPVGVIEIDPDQAYHPDPNQLLLESDCPNSGRSPFDVSDNLDW